MVYRICIPYDIELCVFDFMMWRIDITPLFILNMTVSEGRGS